MTNTSLRCKNLASLTALGVTPTTSYQILVGKFSQRWFNPPGRTTNTTYEICPTPYHIGSAAPDLAALPPSPDTRHLCPLQAGCPSYPPNNNIKALKSLLLFGECCCRRSFQPGDCIIISLVYARQTTIELR